ncbi:MAG: hypothetical protein J6S85_09840 [Methanobrevibacter sp.]|nr:hypothetical protein [Methanobrevibacter sp.]
MSRENLFNYLDEFVFASEEEVTFATTDFFIREFGDPSYADLVTIEERADEYKTARGLH